MFSGDRNFKVGRASFELHDSYNLQDSKVLTSQSYELFRRVYEQLYAVHKSAFDAPLLLTSGVARGWTLGAEGPGWHLLGGCNLLVKINF